MKIFITAIFFFIGLACIIIGAELLHIRMNDMSIILAREKKKYSILPISIIVIGSIIVITAVIVFFIFII